MLDVQVMFHFSFLICRWTWETCFLAFFFRKFVFLTLLKIESFFRYFSWSPKQKGSLKLCCFFQPSFCLQTESKNVGFFLFFFYQPNCRVPIGLASLENNEIYSKIQTPLSPKKWREGGRIYFWIYARYGFFYF